MKVYIIIEDDCETNGAQIQAVFASKEKAEEYAAKQREHWGYYYVIEEDVIE